MNRVLLILLIAVLAVGCASEKRVPRDLSENTHKSSEEAFVRIYGIQGISTMLDSYDDISYMEGVREGDSFTVSFRTRQSRGDVIARWPRLSMTQINNLNLPPYLVQATCVNAICNQVAVLITYAPTRNDAPLTAGVMLFQSKVDSRYFDVGYSSSGTVAEYPF
jgi:hypothetical protein